MVFGFINGVLLSFSGTIEVLMELLLYTMLRMAKVLQMSKDGFMK